ncbi:hypothetical protein DICPUDRAFT_46933 [Dictyostelium purpureum]|uniref:Flavin-containing monooxygenase n=1 Tax=Dictyostelium purpureum TaxID=5786 RepID=F0ZGY6_DICPU|nr:uncharacterized protein DICPUDRAFT_46933 [Dictyostelium purpureum]EGC36796.1 hypothetical protein DICPUDRAFT_46933 [Dictyostelium purpureum]|eukprot:XP_003286667.1 hypothetical protein DICPUDRAFT_46933 [Dictyostelium purpureum]
MKTIAIIGGGPSGLVSAKSALECGLVPTVFEKQENFGGNWAPNTTKAWNSLRTNVSKFSCAFSDFPHDINDSDMFLPQEKVYNYLYNYAKKFNVLSHINTSCSVTRVSKAEQDSWKIEWIDNTDKESPKAKEQVFNFVIIASGINSTPAKFDQGGLLNSYTGNVIHSREYKSPESYKDKRVLLIGNAFSGSQIAVDLAKTSKSVHQVVRRDNQWVLSNTIPLVVDKEKGTETNAPIDFVFYVRKTSYENNKLSKPEYNQTLNNIVQFLTKNNLSCEDFKYSQDAFSLPPYFIIAHEDYIPSVEKGDIQLLRNCAIKNVNEKQITFEFKEQDVDEKSFEFDEIILCTGYQTDLTFLDKEILNEIEYIPDDYYVSCLLHKNVFPRNLKNIGFVGIINTPFFNTLELMSRWVVYVFSGLIKEPTKEIIENGIKDQINIRNANAEIKYQFPYNDTVIHCDDLAKEIGVLPDFEEIKKNDQDLYNSLWNVVYCNSCYRLKGPFSNPTLAKQTLSHYNETFNKVMSP